MKYVWKWTKSRMRWKNAASTWATCSIPSRTCRIVEGWSIPRPWPSYSQRIFARFTGSWSRIRAPGTRCLLATSLKKPFRMSWLPSLKETTGWPTCPVPTAIASWTKFLGRWQAPCSTLLHLIIVKTKTVKFTWSGIATRYRSTNKKNKNKWS